MVLDRITDACRKHGAIIISGHHHLYSRTKMLQSVGSESGKDPVPVSGTGNDKFNFVVSEGLTMSITTGMGGYDGGCNGKYWNATWMDRCIASLSDHRGAIIAEFDEKDTTIGMFQYLNSMKNGDVVDEFQITSRLPGSISKAPTRRPSPKPSPKPTQEPTRDPTREPTHEPTEEPTRKPTDEPTSQKAEPATSKPTETKNEPRSPEPTFKPSPRPTFKLEPETKKPTQDEKTKKPTPAKKTKEPTGDEKGPSDKTCISVSK